MRKLRTILLAGASATLVAGAAVAAEKYHVMNVALPDGSVAQIHYQGDVAPQVVVADAPVRQIAVDPFADMDAMFAAMEARHDQLMRQVAQMQAQAADAIRQAESQTRTVAATSGGATPANGIVQYSFVSTTNADGCTTSVQWRSDGSGAQPQVVKTSAGSCAAAKPAAAKPTKAAAPKAEAPKPIPGANRT